MRGACGPGGSTPGAGRQRPVRVPALALLLLLLLLGWPVCGSEESEGRTVVRPPQHEGAAPGLDGRGAAGPTPGGAAAVMLARLRHPASGTLPSSAGADAATMQAPSAVRRQPSRQRRGLQSNALRMLHDLAQLVLPRAATLPRVHAEVQAQRKSAEHAPGGWAEAYICLLHRTQRELRAERLREEELERKEQGNAQDQISACRSRLSQIQEALVQATRDKTAIGRSLRKWQQMDLQGPGEESRGTSPQSPRDIDAEPDAATTVQRLQADRLRSETHVRGLQVLLAFRLHHIPHSVFGIVVGTTVSACILWLLPDKLLLGCAGAGKASSDTLRPDDMARSAGAEGCTTPQKQIAATRGGAYRRSGPGCMGIGQYVPQHSAKCHPARVLIKTARIVFFHLFMDIAQNLWPERRWTIRERLDNAACAATELPAG